MQILPLLVQLPVLRAQGPFNQHVYLPALCHEPSLVKPKETDSKTPQATSWGVLLFYRNEDSVSSSLVSSSSRTGSSQVPESQVCIPKRGKTQRLRMYQAAKTPTRIRKDFITAPIII